VIGELIDSYLLAQRKLVHSTGESSWSVVDKERRVERDPW